MEARYSAEKNMRKRSYRERKELCEVAKTTEEQVDIKKSIDGLVKQFGVRWYRPVLKRNHDGVLRVAVDLEVSGKRERGRPKKT